MAVSFVLFIFQNPPPHPKTSSLFSFFYWSGLNFDDSLISNFVLLIMSVRSHWEIFKLCILIGVLSYICLHNKLWWVILFNPSLDWEGGALSCLPFFLSICIAYFYQSLSPFLPLFIFEVNFSFAGVSFGKEKPKGIETSKWINIWPVKMNRNANKATETWFIADRDYLSPTRPG